MKNLLWLIAFFPSYSMAAGICGSGTLATTYNPYTNKQDYVCNGFTGSGGSVTTIVVQEGGSTVVTTSTIDFNASQFNISNASGKASVVIDTNSAGGIMALSTGTNSAGQLLRLDANAFVPNANIDSSSVTKQGNIFNGANQLVQLNGSTQLPAVSGVNLTNLNASNLASGTVPNSRLDSSSVTLQGNSFTQNGAVYGLGSGLTTTAAGAEGTFLRETSGVPSFSTIKATDIAPGSLGPSVLVASLPANVSYWNVSETRSAQQTINNSSVSFVNTSTLNVAGGAFVMPKGASLLMPTTAQAGMDTTHDTFNMTDSSGIQHVYAHYEHHWGIGFSTAPGGWSNLTVPMPKFTNRMAATLLQVDVLVYAQATSTITFNMDIRPSTNTTTVGANIFTVTSTAVYGSGITYTSFAYTNIPAGSYPVFKTGSSAETGSPQEILIDIWSEEKVE